MNMPQKKMLLLLMSILSLYMQPLLAIEVDPGPSRLICQGQSTILGGSPTLPPDVATSVLLTWYTVMGPDDMEILPPDQANLLNPTVSPTETTLYKVMGTDEVGESVCEANVTVYVTNIVLNAVTFYGGHTIREDPTIYEPFPPSYPTSFQWMSGTALSPLCYTSSIAVPLTPKFIEVSGEFSILEWNYIPLDLQNDFLNKISIKVTSGTDEDEYVYNFETNDIIFDSGTTFGDFTFLPIVADVPLPTHIIDYKEAFKLNWEISFNDGIDETWCEFGLSENALYLTLQEPILTDASFFHTTLHLSCLNAKNVIDPINNQLDVVDAI